MRLTELVLQDFRNIEAARVSFSDGVNIVSGDNAQGKTSLLEAVYLLSAARSFRTRKQREMIRRGAAEAFAEASFLREREEPARVRMALSQKNKRVFRNGAQVTKLSDFIGFLRVVLFVPEHLSMVREGPAVRRAFLDGAISQLFPLYPSTLNEHNKLYEIRCKLLQQTRENPKNRELFALYDESTARVSAKIAMARRAYLAELFPIAAAQYAQISEERETLILTYESDIPAACETEEEIAAFTLTRLQKNLEMDLRCGFPVHGVHRDDIGISLDRDSARAYASQGQQRSIVLALKLAEGALCARRGEEEPVYLLDDVLSELDRRRRAFVLSQVGKGQTILTACEPLRQKALSGARRIAVREGRFY